MPLYLRMSILSGLVLATAGPLFAAEVSPPVLISSRNAIMPLELVDAGLRDPIAQVEVVVAPDGAVSDAICIEASHYLMAERAEAIARDCVFSPATDDGAAVAVRHLLTIHFEFADSASSIKTLVDEDVARPLDQGNRDEALVTRKASELDEPLSVADRPPAVLVRDESGVVRLGRAVIEGYVDMDGRFRFLSVVEADDRYVAEAAVQNLAAMRFNPPRYKGVRVTTKIRIPFVASK